MSQYPFHSAAYCMSRDYTIPNMCVGIEPQFTNTKRLVIECGRTSEPSYCCAPVCDNSAPYSLLPKRFKQVCLVHACLTCSVGCRFMFHKASVPTVLCKVRFSLPGEHSSYNGLRFLPFTSLITYYYYYCY